ncbi:MAG: S26 family signal peptidase [Clostridia bacterium]|nr:S26 family signal peptidase [Clostridia bacterium]
MANNWKNYKKKISDEKKAAVKETKAKKKKILTYAAWIGVSVLAVAAIVVAIILGSGNGDTDKNSTETTTAATTHSHVHENTGTGSNVTTPVVSSLIPITDNDMAPLINSGDTAEVVPVKDESELKVGDIIAYVDTVVSGKSIYKVLRINDILENEGIKFYEVKGDAKDEAEYGLIPFDEVVGKFKEVKNITNEELWELLNGSAE